MVVGTGGRCPGGHDARPECFPLRRALVGAVVLAALTTAFLLGLSALSRASAEVNPDGSYGGEVTIDVPAYRGLEPRLRLTYDSNAGNGWIGVGRQLGGLSKVERGSPGRGAPTYTADDHFFLDGAELLPCRPGSTSPSCRYALPGTTAFTTTVEGYQRIARDDGLPQGRFVVWTTAGVKSTYEPDLVLRSGAQGAFSWRLASVEDPLGNAVQYHYWQDSVPGVGAASYLGSITYNGTEITFYSEPRPDPVQIATGDRVSVLQRFRLRTVDVHAGDRRARSYAVRYTIDQTGTGRSHVSEVQQYGRDAVVSGTGEITAGSTLPPVRFAVPKSAPQRWADDRPEAGVAWEPARDGTPYDHAKYTVPKESGFMRAYDGNRWMSGDVNGDGLRDLMLVSSYGNAILRVGTAVAQPDGSYVRSEQDMPYGDLDFLTTVGPYGGFFFPGDVDGDGRTDIMGTSVRYGKIVLIVGTSKGDGTYAFRDLQDTQMDWAGVTIARDFSLNFSISLNIAPNASLAWGGTLYASNAHAFVSQRWMSGDLNGDGRSDLMLAAEQEHRDASGRRSFTTLLCSVLAQPAGGFTIRPCQDVGWDDDSDQRDRRVYAGDVDGDSRTDYIMVSHVTRPDGRETVRYHVGYAADGGFATPRTYDTEQPWQPDDLFFPGDTNGDGRTDIMHVIKNEAPEPHAVLRSWEFNEAADTFVGTRPQETGHRWYLPPPCIGDWTPTLWLPGDDDGDGRTDFLHVYSDANTNCFTAGDQRVKLGVAASRPGGTFAVSDRDPGYAWRTDQPQGFVPTDVNGDGRTDLAFATAEVNRPWRVDTALAPGSRRDAHRWHQDDVTGDGRTDLVHIEELDPGIRVSTVSRNADGRLPGVGAARTQDFRPDADMPGLDFVDMDRWQPADVNADGRTDYVYVGYDRRETCVTDPVPGCSKDAEQSGLRIYSLISGGSAGWRLVHHRVAGRPQEDVSQWRVADTDGDGRSDLVHLGFERRDAGWTTTVETLTADSDEGHWIAHAPYVLAGEDAWPGWSGRDPPPTWTPSDTRNWKVTDVDGDGRADLVHLQYHRRYDTHLLRHSVSVHTVRSLGAGTWAPVVSRQVRAPSEVPATARWRLADVNGDGKSDLLQVGQLDPGLRIDTLIGSGGGDWQYRRSSVRTGDPASASPPDAQNWLAADTDGTGTSNLVHLRKWGGGVTVDLVTSDGSGGWHDHPSEPLSWPGVTSPDTVTWKLADVDGNGQVDLTRTDLTDPTRTDSTITTSTAYSVAERENLRGVTEPDGGRVSLSYAASSRFAPVDPPDGCRLPVSVSRTVVAAVSTSDGRSPAWDTSTHRYRCPRWSREVRSLLAWDTRETTTSAAANRPGSVATQHYTTYAAGIVQPDRTERHDDTGRLLGSSSTVYGPPGPAAPYRSVPVSTRNATCREDGVCAARQVDDTPDEFGNITQRIEYDGRGGVLRSTIRTFRPDPAHYFVASAASESVYARGDTTIAPVRATTYCYDDDPTCRAAPTRGLLTSVRQWYEEGSRTVSTGFSYDRWGNPTGRTDANGHTTTTTYDPRFHLFPTDRCNAAGECVVQTWDTAVGQPATVTDPNGQVEQHTYDPFGRVESVTHPNTPRGGRQVRYLDWGDPTRQRVRVVDDDGTADGLWTEQFVDGHSRTWRTLTESTDPARPDARDVEYADSSSRVFRQSDWYSSGDPAPGPEVFRYDAAGRVREQIHPDNSRRRWEYGNDAGRQDVTATDELGRRRTVHSDVNGRTVEVTEEHDGRTLSTGYRYDDIDELVAVTDSAGNRSTTSYDSLGRTTAEQDPDSGTWSYRYDDAGNLTRQTDARRIATAFEYDAADRLVARRRPGAARAQAVWRYGEGGHGPAVGRLTSIEQPGERVTQGTFYDPTGMVERTSTSVDGVGFSMGFGYDRLGRPSSVTYPSGEEVRTEYDAAGRIEAVPGIVESIRYDPAGRPRTDTLGNGLAERRGYDPNRGWLRSTSATGASGTVYDESYDVGADGSPRSSSSSTNAMNLTYGRDDLGRLTSVTGDVAETFTYDDLGNTTYSSRVGDLRYPRSGPDGCGASEPCPRPHAARSAGGVPLRYDANGNLTRNDRTTITWSDSNQVRTVRLGGGRSVRYTNDATDQPVLEERRDGTTVIERVYRFGPWLEFSSLTGLTRNYFAGDRLVARGTGAPGRMPTRTWLHDDQRGSPRAITDERGQVVARQDYYAYGERYPGGAPVPGPGFAGSDTDGSGLLRLGARSYDPRLGRFLSPDSIVPDPLAPQGLNRYAFGYDDPSSYTDPSGHEPEPVNAPQVEGYPIYLAPSEPGRGEPSGRTTTWRAPPRDPTVVAHCTQCRLGVASLDRPFYDGPDGPSLFPFVPPDAGDPSMRPMVGGDADAGPSWRAQEPGHDGRLSRGDLEREALKQQYPGVTPELARIAHGLDETTALMRNFNALFSGVGPQSMRVGWSRSGPRYPVGTPSGAPHNLLVVVPRRTGGYASWQERSGEMTRDQRELGFPYGMNASHTEAKALGRPEVQPQNVAPGGVIRMFGQLPPCRGSCSPSLQRYVDQNNLFILYGWQQDGETRYRLFVPPGEVPHLPR